MVDLREGMTMSDRPANATSTDLEKSSINYYGNATGYLVQPAGETNLPAVVVIHEWWGLNQHIKDAADRLAAEGYVVLAADLYSSEVATAPDRGATRSATPPAIAARRASARTEHRRRAHRAGPGGGGAHDGPPC